jgi:hypothetical protein
MGVSSWQKGISSVYPFANLTAAGGEGFLTKFLTGGGQKMGDWCGLVRSRAKGLTVRIFREIGETTGLGGKTI